MKFKTGDICPISGIWFSEESREEIENLKGDVFPTFNRKRAHWILHKAFEKENA
jgi:hypothetical protein